MKNIKFFAAFVIITSVFSCSKEDTNETPQVLSRWHLIEVREDSEESGKYQSTDKQEEVKFYSNSTIFSSTSWCTSSVVQEANFTVNPNRINIDCDNSISMTYEINGNLLYIFPYCESSCGYKYIRIM